jgi:hypothetical protein
MNVSAALCDGTLCQIDAYEFACRHRERHGDQISAVARPQLENTAPLRRRRRQSKQSGYGREPVRVRLR